VSTVDGTFLHLQFESDPHTAARPAPMLLSPSVLASVSKQSAPLSTPGINITVIITYYKPTAVL
jgi:hypothetical protein